MTLPDFLNIFIWWFIFFVVGLAFLLPTAKLFSNFFDKGYLFAKVIGISVISYLVFLSGTLHILPFTQNAIIFFFMLVCILNIFYITKLQHNTIVVRKSALFQIQSFWAIFVCEELLFFSGLLLWSYVRGFQPDIHGLEKFMDYGFINSILRSSYFPPRDMWFPPYSINYYYFGHLVTAVLTKASTIPSSITFNLMLATIFSFTLTLPFSIGGTFFYTTTLKKPRILQTIIAGVLSAYLVTFAGNLHTIYSFFKPYQTDNPLPPWQLAFLPQSFPNSYWYPNATRYIYHTIHEFPMYSFVVSDLHGHVLDIPFVLLTIALLFSIFLRRKNENIQRYSNTLTTITATLLSWKLEIIVIGFFLAVMYMTNAWDGPIYFLLSFLVIVTTVWINHEKLLMRSSVITICLPILAVLGVVTALFTIPFSLNFNPSAIAHGIGVLCAPHVLTNLGRIEPFLFEANHCQHSEWWQLLVLYGFFYFWCISFIIFLTRTKRAYAPDLFALLLVILSTVLILIPEFFYLKDIYPAHYRANTMFKLVYQAYIMLSLVSVYAIVRLLPYLKTIRFGLYSFFAFLWLIIGFVSICLVAIYPYFAIPSYYNNLQTYKGIDGTAYIKTLYPDDYNTILWINSHIQGQPVLVEAQGDSYTDYARISANTGLPTILGWTVHEWLWRGTYDIPAPRILEVTTLYETTSPNVAKQILRKYHAQYVYVGTLERQKYSTLNEDTFKTLGTVVYESGQSRLYKITD